MMRSITRRILRTYILRAAGRGTLVFGVSCSKQSVVRSIVVGDVENRRQSARETMECCHKETKQARLVGDEVRFWSIVRGTVTVGLRRYIGTDL